jgi:uncharacterized membrane protein HdeD (DUF308 family)
VVAAECLSRLWWVLLLRGVVLILLGGYAALAPGMTIAALTQVLGIFAIIDGVLAIIAGILGLVESRGWTLLRGVLALLIGAFVFSHPLLVGVLAVTTIVLIIAIQAIAVGVLEIVVAIRDRQTLQGEGWLILSGVLSVVFGLLLCGVPLASGLALVRVVGFFAVAFGIALCVLAFRVRNLGSIVNKAA